MRMSEPGRPPTPRRDDLVIRRYVRRIIVALLLSGPIGLPAGVANAAPRSTLDPPPGCTGDWNTAQPAANNHAPGDSPACLNHLPTPDPSHLLTPPHSL